MNTSTAYVLVVGAASIDVKGRARKMLQLGTSTPGEVTVSFGGVGRNVAENLARLGQPTILLSAVGRDTLGSQILEHTASAGVDVSRVIISPQRHSAAYVAILDELGSKTFAVDEMAAMGLVTPAYLQTHRALFQNAAMLVLDANLSPAALTSRSARPNTLACQ